MSGEQFPDILYREVPRNRVSALGKSNSGYEADSLAIISDNLWGRFGVVRKWTQYVTGSADVMIIPLGSNVSQLTELEAPRLGRFLHLCGSLVAEMHRECGNGFPVVAINQQPECVNIPDKYAADGTELKVQTINEVHAHLYIENGKYNHTIPPSKLKAEDRYSFIDPLGIIAGGLIYKEACDTLERIPGFVKLHLFDDKYPLGVNFELTGGISENLDKTELCAFVADTQSWIFGIYRSLENKLRQTTDRTDVVDWFLKEHHMDKKSADYISKIISIIRDHSVVEKKHHRFVPGPAMTWIIYERGGNTFVNLAPRILSRGNASESFGVWVEPVDNIDGNGEMVSDQKKFWDSIITKLSKTLDITKGPTYDNPI
ncbi:hypothetical protein HZB69_03175 [Candidatus Amesbacteria bacterium]|nr:hypothetical protein [Candidatus Amesbacteria bacterium]